MRTTESATDTGTGALIDSAGTGLLGRIGTGVLRHGRATALI
jgi:hypothetical protein